MHLYKLLNQKLNLKKWKQKLITQKKKQLMHLAEQ